MTLATASALQAWRSQWKAILLGVALTLTTYAAAWQLAVLVDQRSSYVVPEPAEAQAILAAAIDYEIAVVQAEIDFQAKFDRGETRLPNKFQTQISHHSIAAAPCQIFDCDVVIMQMITRRSVARFSDGFWYSPRIYLQQFEQDTGLSGVQLDNMPSADAPPLILSTELIRRRLPVSPAIPLPPKHRRDLQLLSDQISSDAGQFITFDSPLRHGDWAIVGRRKACWINGGGFCGEGVLYALRQEVDGWRVKAVGLAFVS